MPISILMTLSHGQLKKDAQRMNDILFTICEQIKNISILLNPIIPTSTSKVLTS